MELVFKDVHFQWKHRVLPFSIKLVFMQKGRKSLSTFWHSEQWRNQRMENSTVCSAKPLKSPQPSLTFLLPELSFLEADAAANKSHTPSCPSSCRLHDERVSTGRLTKDPICCRRSAAWASLFESVLSISRAQKLPFTFGLCGKRERFIRGKGRWWGGGVVKGTKKRRGNRWRKCFTKRRRQGWRKEGGIKKKDTTAGGEIGASWQRRIQTLSIIFGDFVNKGEERTGWPGTPGWINTDLESGPADRWPHEEEEVVEEDEEEKEDDDEKLFFLSSRGNSLFLCVFHLVLLNIRSANRQC